ncbi:MAG TPA: flagellar hook-basal body complex protein FliE [Bryobacteraceae bacterium]|jgi:flagellar hook-basal body complex protein FliE|nr:flagellar hook-basal body complex protein FliE [Bryobacteraceae bacterium]
MSVPIAPIHSVPAIATGLAPRAAGESAAGTFQSLLTDAVSRVETLNHNAQDSVMKFLSGEGGEIHRVALNVQESQMAFEMFLQVRNKVVSAYQEIMRMQL